MSDVFGFASDHPHALANVARKAGQAATAPQKGAAAIPPAGTLKGTIVQVYNGPSAGTVQVQLAEDPTGKSPTADQLFLATAVRCKPGDVVLVERYGPQMIVAAVLNVDYESKNVNTIGFGAGVFQNGWYSYGSGAGPARYYLDADEHVNLAGWVTPTAGTTPTGESVVFVLPVGYRPGYGVSFIQEAYGSPTGLGPVYVNAVGEVRAPNYGVTYVSLDGIRFPVSGGA